MILTVIFTILAVAATATVLATQPRTALMKALVPALVIGGTFGASVEANAQAGWYELGGGWACQVLPAHEARHYGWLLTQPSTTETRIRNIANFLGRLRAEPVGESGEDPLQVHGLRVVSASLADRLVCGSFAVRLHLPPLGRARLGVHDLVDPVRLAAPVV